MKCMAQAGVLWGILSEQQNDLDLLLQMDGEAPKKKWRFLQKYWHKGAFFQEAPDNPYTDEHAENIFRRDYSNPTGEDKMDKTVLPKIMQVSRCTIPVPHLVAAE